MIIKESSENLRVVLSKEDKEAFDKTIDILKNLSDILQNKRVFSLHAHLTTYGLDNLYDVFQTLIDIRNDTDLMLSL